MRTPDPNFTPQEAEQARAYLLEHASEVQRAGIGHLDEEGRQYFVVVDELTEEEAESRGKGEKAGEQVLFVTTNDELIVDFWRHLTGGKPPEDVRERIHRMLGNGHRSSED